MIRKLVNPRLRFIEEPNPAEGGSSTKEQEPDVSAESASTEGDDDGASQEEEAGSESEDDENLKDAAWLTKELDRTRRESANYRTQLREAQEALAQAKTPEDIEAAVKELTEKLAASEMALVRERVSNAHKLPAELAELLKGETEDELVAHAKTLAKFAPADEAAPNRLSGGLDPDDDENFDPVAEAKKARASRR